MFVLSVKSSKLKSVAASVVVLACAAVAVFLVNSRQTSDVSRDGLFLKASSASERLAFLSQFGWEVDEDPIEVSEVIIPAEFDKAFEDYNDIQKSQGFDLYKYNGMRVKRWTYEIKNYPGYDADSGFIQANLLIYNGFVIGGDVCSLELDGFIAGFEMPEEVTSTSNAGTTA